MCWVADWRAMASWPHSSPSVCPLRWRRLSSRCRRAGSASALKTLSAVVVTFHYAGKYLHNVKLLEGAFKWPEAQGAEPAARRASVGWGARGSGAGEQFAGFAVFRGLFGDGPRLEAGGVEQAEPGAAGEQPQPVRLVHGADRAAGLPEQERVLGHGPGVGRIRIPVPFQVARPTAVGAIDAAVPGAGLVGLGDVIGHEHSHAARPAVRERGLDDPRE